MINLNVTDKQVELSLTLTDADETTLSFETIVDSLNEQDVCCGILEDVINDIVLQVNEHGNSEQPSKPVIENVIVARQIEPTPGTPAAIEFLLSNTQIVAPGDIIAQLADAVPGEDGKSLNGEVIPAAEVTKTELSAGPNTEVVEEKKIVAQLYGTLLIKGKDISVNSLVTVSQNNLEAYVDIHPQSAAQKAIELTMVEAALQTVGVTYGIDQDAIRNAIAKASEAQSPENRVCVAKGLDAVAAVVATFDFAFQVAGAAPNEVTTEMRQAAAKENKLIFDLVDSGEVICTEMPAIEDQTGMSVLGEEIKPPAAEKATPVPQCGENTERKDGETEYVSTIFGYVDYKNGQLRVRSPISVSDDGMQVCLNLHPRQSKEKVLSRKDIEILLAKNNIIYGISWKRIDKILEMVAKDGMCRKNLWIATGKPPIPGEDAYLKFYMETRKTIGAKRDDGSVDFRELSAIRNVKSGVKICQRIPHTEGKPKVDIFGQSDPAEAGNDIEFKVGDNVEAREAEFWSTDDGFVLINDNTVSVSEVYEVAGDIDLNTGNLRLEDGAIHISGTIRTGFEVFASSHILVNQLVEDALVESKGNIEVGGGIVHNENGRVTAKGQICAKFAQNASLTAEGDITIAGAAINCNLHSGSQIIISGSKGNLVGGTAHASKRIEVQQLGAETGVITELEINLDNRSIERINAEIVALQKKISLNAENKDKNEDEGEDEDKFDDKHEGKYGAEYNDNQQLQLLIEQSEVAMSVDKSAEIVVKGHLYPPVVIKFYDRVRKVTSEHKACKIILNEDHEILITPLDP